VESNLAFGTTGPQRERREESQFTPKEERKMKIHFFFFSFFLLQTCLDTLPLVVATTAASSSSNSEGKNDSEAETVGSCVASDASGETCEDTTTTTTATTSDVPITTNDNNVYNDPQMVENKCEDLDPVNCPALAAKGDCTSNPFSTLFKCKLSCEVCKQDCTDKHPQCEEWQLMGECTNNPTYMEENCKNSCICNIPCQNTGVNRGHQCNAWAWYGEWCVVAFFPWSFVVIVQKRD
jgi:hypothetical protein